MNTLTKFFSLPSFQKNKLEAEVKKTRSLRKSLSKAKQRTRQVSLTVEGYQKAIQKAKNPQYPNRHSLQAIYSEVLLDLHVLSQVSNRKNKSLQEEFVILTNDEVNKEKTKLFKTPWFREVQDIYFETYLHGHSLIEFGEFNDKGEFEDAWLIERRFVEPNQGLILPKSSSKNGLSFREKQEWNEDLILLEVGSKKKSLGLLEAVTRAIIRKENALAGWAEHADTFAHPITWMETDAEDDATLDAYEDWLSNLGGRRYGMGKKGDLVKLIEENRQNPHLIFEKLIIYMDDLIAKGIGGQSGVSDMKAFVGSARVMERMLLGYALVDMINFMFFVDFVLIPFLRKQGGKYSILNENDQFTFKRFMLTDENQEVEEQNEGSEVEPKESSKGILPTQVQTRNNETLLDLVLKTIESVFKGELTIGVIDQSLYTWFSKKYIEAIHKGYGNDFDFDSPERATLVKLENSQRIFVAHKNYHFIKALNEALTDDNGNLRSFTQFKKEAFKIHDQWHIQWYEAEYNTSVNAAHSAREWVQAWENREVLPNLRYITAGDKNVRPSHQKLNGIVRPITDSFWNTHYPPNGYKCRCGVQQEDEEVTLTKPSDIPDITVHPAFRHNVGKTGQVFDEAHAYFQDINQEGKANIKKASKPPKEKK